MQRITLGSVTEKFEDKGFDIFFFYQISSIPLIYIPSVLALEIHGNSRKAAVAFYESESVQKELDYWNTWIDYQNYR